MNLKHPVQQYPKCQRRSGVVHQMNCLQSRQPAVAVGRSLQADAQLDFDPLFNQARGELNGASSTLILSVGHSILSDISAKPHQIQNPE